MLMDFSYLLTIVLSSQSLASSLHEAQRRGEREMDWMNIFLASAGALSSFRTTP